MTHSKELSSSLPPTKMCSQTVESRSVGPNLVQPQHGRITGSSIRTPGSGQVLQLQDSPGHWRLVFELANAESSAPWCTSALWGNFTSRPDICRQAPRSVTSKSLSRTPQLTAVAPSIVRLHAPLLLQCTSLFLGLSVHRSATPGHVRRWGRSGSAVPVSFLAPDRRF